MKNRPPSNDGEVATQNTVAIAIQTPISTAAGRSRRNIPIAPATGSHCSSRFDQKNSRTLRHRELEPIERRVAERHRRSARGPVAPEQRRQHGHDQHDGRLADGAPAAGDRKGGENASGHAGRHRGARDRGGGEEAREERRPRSTRHGSECEQRSDEREHHRRVGRVDGEPVDHRQHIVDVDPVVLGGEEVERPAIGPRSQTAAARPANRRPAMRRPISSRQ